MPPKRKDIFASDEFKVSQPIMNLLKIGDDVIKEVRGLFRDNSPGNISWREDKTHYIDDHEAADRAYQYVNHRIGVSDTLPGKLKRDLKEIKGRGVGEYGRDKKWQKDYEKRFEKDVTNKKKHINYENAWWRPRRIYQLLKTAQGGNCDFTGPTAYYLCRQRLGGEYFSAWVTTTTHNFAIIGPMSSLKDWGGKGSDTTQWVAVDPWPARTRAVRFIHHFSRHDRTLTWCVIAFGKMTEGKNKDKVLDISKEFSQMLGKGVFLDTPSDGAFSYADFGTNVEDLPEWRDKQYTVASNN